MLVQTVVVVVVLDEVAVVLSVLRILLRQWPLVTQFTLRLTLRLLLMTIFLSKEASRPLLGLFLLDVLQQSLLVRLLQMLHLLQVVV